MSTQFIRHLLLAFTIMSTPVWAEAPATFNYTGQVNVKGTPFEGNGFFRFALVNFDCTEATNAIAENCKTLWSNDGSSTQGSEPVAAVELIVSKGKFNIDIGDTSNAGSVPLDPNLLQQKPLYLRTWFDDGKNGAEQLKPDYELKSTPYALASKVAENGIGQVWAEQLSNRGVGNIYLNDTGRAISIRVSYGFIDQGTGDRITYSFFIDKATPPTNKIIDLIPSNTFSIIVPNGQYYQLKIANDLGRTNSIILGSWMELR
ncbi:hypothetical protein MNBD_GAMMA07-133 [hydrothermal vent metagenome]|uniref:Uncharacterized protein n=1 Tax=hydrothermal vent metagenome TaxID=652676 RepID=A0A3B0XL94_9ZZZZ